jgi:hypothetical protein
MMYGSKHSPKRSFIAEDTSEELLPPSSFIFHLQGRMRRNKSHQKFEKAEDNNRWRRHTAFIKGFLINKETGPCLPLPGSIGNRKLEMLTLVNRFYACVFPIFESNSKHFRQKYSQAA